MNKKTQDPSESISDSGDSVRKLPENNYDKISSQIEILDSERIGHLKLAIHEGNYAINPLRVAEKFIQFENLLNT